MAHRYLAFLRNYSLVLPIRAPTYLYPADARFLVLSDLHASNRLGLAQAVVDAEGAAGRNVSAVLILVDLVNLGIPSELRLTRLRASLERLSIPVLLILGKL